MAKKQTFGDKVLAAKLAQRKMAKVIVSEKSPKGTITYREATIDVDKVNDFISANK
ncbi:MAG: hypothetical protein HLUCCA01_06350 [Bacteroidetes bacterium HLUCCA01]|nr:MAG: hypothetical protein HLUCCA01_06350 [Bacteroidetes bacterium HLUCCA01]